MYKIFETLKKIRFSSPLTAPFLIFLACFFSFGLLLSNLGFFQDDWHHVYYGYHEGLAGLKAFFLTDSRPLAYGLYGLLFQVLGFDPSHWHWSLMLLRFLTALGVWAVAHQLWPTENELTTWLGLFFALHPVFTLQPLSVAYTLHWVSYLAVACSFVFMLMALKANSRRRLWLGLALLLQAAHLVLMEYYVGLEVVRLVILWLARPDGSIRERVTQTIRRWLPYLLVLILYAGYRLSFSYLFGYDRFESILLIWLENPPIQTLVGILQNMLQDSIYILISPWYTAILPSVFDLSRPSTWQMLGSVSIFAALFFWVISRLPNSTENSPNQDRLPISVFLAGLLTLFLGMLPSWLVGFVMYAKNPLWSSRLALPAMLGASLATVGLVYSFVPHRARRNLFLSILLGIAFGAQIQTAREFKASWDKQLQFYWQLYWRAPSLQSGTLVVADSEILPYMGDSPTAFALNLLYPKTTRPPNMDTWFNPGSANLLFLPFEQGSPFEFSKYSSTFTATSAQVLAITFEPSQGQCLWALRPPYREVRFFSEEAYRWMALSDLSRIQSTPGTPPPAAIFGAEPAHTWCYYYEKADLAAQAKDWPQITSLWEQAAAQGYQPSASVELLPFIVAYARTSNWEQAHELTLSANLLAPKMPNRLCTIWQTFSAEGLVTPENASLFEDVKDRLNCQE